MKLFLKIFDRFSNHRTWMYVVVCLLLLLCTVSALRMEYNEDISAFMPLDEETGKYSEVFGNLGGQNTIAVIFKGKSEYGKADGLSNIEAGIDVFGEAVARHDTGHIVQNLRLRVDESVIGDMLQLVWQNYPLLLSDWDYHCLDSLMNDEAYLSKQLEQNKLMLMFPTGSIITQSIPYDPLHLSMGIANRLRELNMDSSYQTVDGYLFKDSAGIVLLESPFGMSESRNNLLLKQVLDSCIADVQAEYPSLSVSAVGAPLIAVTNAMQIKADSVFAVILSVILILAVLLYAFRRISDLLWIGISVFAGWLFALGVIALMCDEISLIVIGIGSVIIGIAVNYPLHFIEHLKHETNMREALKEMIPPLFVGNVTTVSAFLCLVLLDARAMRDLGLFGSLTLIGTILFVLVCLPIFLKPRSKAESNDKEFGWCKWRYALHGKWLRRTVLWTIIGLTAVFGYFSVDTSFDSDMQHINYMLPEQREGLKFLSSSLQGRNEGLLTLYAVAEGHTLDEALFRNETMIERISGVEGIEKVVSIAGLIPSDSLCLKRIAQWDSFWNKHQEFERVFETEVVKAGFSDNAFVPFLNLVKNPSPTVLSATQNPIYPLIGRNFILFAENGYKVVNFLQVKKQYGGTVKEAITEVLPADCFVFAQADVSNRLAVVLADSFNYVGFVCGFVVFVFFWLSFRSIELSLMSFLPLAISWIWILGIMEMLGMQFNIVNVILATFIFGQGDDYTIFITEGLMYEYTTGKKRLEKYKNSVALSAVIMFIGIGTLIFSKHPAMRSLAEVTIIGMVTVVVMAYYLPPLIFRWLTEKHGKRREYPVTLRRLAASVFSMAFFICGMYGVFIPYIYLIHKPLQRVWNGEHFFHRLLQRITHFVIRHVPGVKFKEVNEVGETFVKPAVIICNHQSHLDLMCVMQLSPKLIVLTNDWVWNNPYYGVVIHMAEFYPVSNGNDKNFPHLQELVKRGYSIVVFPEGTRTPDGKIGRFHKGAFDLAKSLGIDLLPICIHGLYDVLPKHDFMLRSGSVTLEICERIDSGTIDSMDMRELTSKMRRWYVDKYAAMRLQLETPEYLAPYVAYRNKYKVNVE